MMFQKGKPRPPLKVKTCAICRKSFQPSSGAQKICGEPGCKARSRMQKYLEKKAKENVARIDQDTPVPIRKKQRSETEVPGLELDLSPMAAYIKAMIDQALNVRTDEVKEFIREVVREEISSRLAPLFGRA